MSDDYGAGPYDFLGGMDFLSGATGGDGPGYQGFEQGFDRSMQQAGQGFDPSAYEPPSRTGGGNLGSRSPVGGMLNFGGGRAQTIGSGFDPMSLFDRESGRLIPGLTPEALSYMPELIAPKEDKIGKGLNALAIFAGQVTGDKQLYQTGTQQLAERKAKEQAYVNYQQIRASGMQQRFAELHAETMKAQAQARESAGRFLLGAQAEARQSGNRYDAGATAQLTNDFYPGTMDPGAVGQHLNQLYEGNTHVDPRVNTFDQRFAQEQGQLAGDEMRLASGFQGRQMEAEGAAQLGIDERRMSLEVRQAGREAGARADAGHAADERNIDTIRDVAEARHVESGGAGNPEKVLGPLWRLFQKNDQDAEKRAAFAVPEPDFDSTEWRNRGGGSPEERAAAVDQFMLARTAAATEAAWPGRQQLVDLHWNLATHQDEAKVRRDLQSGKIAMLVEFLDPGDPPAPPPELSEKRATAGGNLMPPQTYEGEFTQRSPAATSLIKRAREYYKRQKVYKAKKVALAQLYEKYGQLEE